LVFIFSKFGCCQNYAHIIFLRKHMSNNC